MNLPLPLRPLINHILKPKGLEISTIPKSWHSRSNCKRYLQCDPSVIFDVGANDGKISAILAGQFPEADIFAFEPTPAPFEAMRRNTRKHKRVTCQQLAVSELCGELTMKVSQNSRLSTVTNVVSPGQSRLTVQATTIDTFCKINSIHQIDLLKIDVEGHEMSVLRGAERALDRCKVLVIEFGLDPSDHRHCHLLDLAKKLSAMNYSLVDLVDINDKNSGRFDYGNAVFVHTV